MEGLYFKKELLRRKKCSWCRFRGEINSLQEVVRLSKVLSWEGKSKDIGSLKRQDCRWSISKEKSQNLLDTHFSGVGTALYISRPSLELNGRHAEGIVTEGYKLGRE